MISRTAVACTCAARTGEPGPGSRCGVANGCACGPSMAWCCTWNPLRKSMEANHDHDRLRPGPAAAHRSEEHTSELQSLMRSSYDVFCLKKTKTIIQTTHHHPSEK